MTQSKRKLQLTRVATVYFKIAPTVNMSVATLLRLRLLVFVELKIKFGE